MTHMQTHTGDTICPHIRTCRELWRHWRARNTELRVQHGPARLVALGYLLKRIAPGWLKQTNKLFPCLRSLGMRFYAYNPRT